MDRTAELFEAAKRGDGATVDRLLDEEPGLLGSRDGDSLSPLTVAYHGKQDVVARLLARGTTLDIFEAAMVGDVDRLTKCSTKTRHSSPRGRSTATSR
jgi:hypothetical protein